MDPQVEIEKLNQAIQALEGQRLLLGEAVVEAALAPLREKLASLQVNPLGEQRKMVTVLFADLVGFTSLAAGMDMEDVREVINAYFQRWAACIKGQDGVVEKYIGDAVLAVFGLPASHEDDPERAVHAALRMQAELAALNERIERQHAIRLSMRVGINTGEVVVSLIGERGGEAFVVVGETVNLASRLQAEAPVDGILITQDTYRHVRGLFETSPYGPLALKGIPNPVQAYWIKAAKPRSFRLGERGVEGVETPLVGRRRELGRLQETYSRCMRAKERSVLTVVGEAGLGKSRLLSEFEEWLDLLPDRISYFRGRAQPGSQNLPYSLFREAFAFRCQIADSDPPTVVQEKFEQNIRQVWGEDETGRMKAHFIARLMGFEIGESKHVRGEEQDPKSLHDRGLLYLVEYFRAVWAAGPAVILFEDLHWSDDSSLDLADHLAAALIDLPFLVVAATRPSLFERRPGWGEGLAYHSRIDLDPLDASQSKALVAEILHKVDPLPNALVELVVNTAEGNPFYIEELIKMLIEDGVIVKGEERWRVEEQRLANLRVPPTLVGVLQARFDSLEREQRLCLQRGAVIGRVFWDKAVEWMTAPESAAPQSAAPESAAPESAAHTGAPGIQLPIPTDEIFKQLRGREMIFRRDVSTFEDTIEYLFKHALLRDVIYNSLLKRQRKLYHLLAARWIEDISGRTRRLGEFTLWIAGHYEQGGEPGLAAEWYLRAGRTAAGHYANREAVRAFSKALELNPDPAPRWTFDVLVQREKVYELLGMRDQQSQDLEAMQALADQTGDTFLNATADLRLAHYEFQTTEYPAALEYARRAESLAAQIQDSELAAGGALLQAMVLMRTGDLDQAETQAQRALSLSGQRGLLGVEASAYRHLGLVYYYQGKHQQALDHFTRALQLYQQAGDRSGEAMAINNLGGANFELGEYEAAEKYYAQSLEMSRQIGDRMGEGRAINNLGIVNVTRGMYEQAEAYYLQALQISREVGHRAFEMSTLDNLGNLAMYRYSFSLAEKYQIQSLNGTRELGDRLSECFSLINLSRLYIFVGDYETASKYIQDNLEINKLVNDSQGNCDTLLNQCEFELMSGDIPSALKSCEQAIRLAQQGDYQSEWALGEHLRGKISFEMKNYAQAAQHFRQAWEIRAHTGEAKEAHESLAWLALAHLEQGDLEQAMNRVEDLVKYMGEHGVLGFDSPQEVFLACYQVLLAAGDPRASEILKQGYDLIQEIGAKMESESMRRSYFDRAPGVRALVDAWQSAGR